MRLQEPLNLHQTWRMLRPWCLHLEVRLFQEGFFWAQGRRPSQVQHYRGQGRENVWKSAQVLQAL